MTSSGVNAQPSGHSITKVTNNAEEERRIETQSEIVVPKEETGGHADLTDLQNHHKNLTGESEALLRLASPSWVVSMETCLTVKVKVIV